MNSMGTDYRNTRNLINSDSSMSQLHFTEGINSDKTGKANKYSINVGNTVSRSRGTSDAGKPARAIHGGMSDADYDVTGPDNTQQYNANTIGAQNDFDEFANSDDDYTGLADGGARQRQYGGVQRRSRSRRSNSFYGGADVDDDDNYDEDLDELEVASRYQVGDNGDDDELSWEDQDGGDDINTEKLWHDLDQLDTEKNHNPMSDIGTNSVRRNTRSQYGGVDSVPPVQPMQATQGKTLEQTFKDMFQQAADFANKTGKKLDANTDLYAKQLAAKTQSAAQNLGTNTQALAEKASRGLGNLADKVNQVGGKKNKNYDDWNTVTSIDETRSMYGGLDNQPVQVPMPLPIQQNPSQDQYVRSGQPTQSGQQIQPTKSGYLDTVSKYVNQAQSATGQVQSLASQGQSFLKSLGLSGGQVNTQPTMQPTQQTQPTMQPTQQTQPGLLDNLSKYATQAQSVTGQATSLAKQAQGLFSGLGLGGNYDDQYGGKGMGEKLKTFLEIAKVMKNTDIVKAEYKSVKFNQLVGAAKYVYIDAEAQITPDQKNADEATREKAIREKALVLAQNPKAYIRQYLIVKEEKDAAKRKEQEQNQSSQNQTSRVQSRSGSNSRSYARSSSRRNRLW